MSNRDDDAVEGEVVDDAWGTAPGWQDDEYIVDETAPPTVDGKLNAMGKDLRLLTLTSLASTLAIALILFLTDLWHGHGFHTTVGFLVGGGLATLNLWMLAGGYFAMVDQRAVLPRLFLGFIGSMVVMFGAALFVIFAKREWTLGFALGLAIPAVGGLAFGFVKQRMSAD